MVTNPLVVDQEVVIRTDENEIQVHIIVTYSFVLDQSLEIE